MAEGLGAGDQRGEFCYSGERKNENSREIFCAVAPVHCQGVGWLTASEKNTMRCRYSKDESRIYCAMRVEWNIIHPSPEFLYFLVNDLK